MMPISATDLRRKIEDRLHHSFPEKEPRELYQAARSMMLSGGKRIRPLLLLMACNLFDDEVDHALDAAVAMEAFHNFSLIHDDIMDHAPLRRNKPTIHVEYGDATAILAGDMLLVKAYELLLQSRHSRQTEALQLFTDTAREVCEGQQFDLRHQGSDEVQYREMIRLKTAVLLGCCLKSGALLSAADSNDCNLLYDFGCALGLAFQLQDDLLDLFADGEHWGKQPGGDLLEGKRTFPVLLALKLAAQKQDDRLVALLNSPQREEMIAPAISILTEYDVERKVIDVVSSYHDHALQLLQQVSCNHDRKQVLTGFVGELMKRRS